MDAKALICLSYLKNVTEYFTALTGKDASSIEEIAWFVDKKTEEEDIPTLDQPLATQAVYAICARLVKEIVTKAEASTGARQRETATRR
jgi:hypothetical protein